MARAPACSRREAEGTAHRLAAVAAVLFGASVAATPAAATLLRPATAAAVAARTGSFAAFVESLWPEAHARGVSRHTFDAAFLGVTPDPAVIEKSHHQAEFRKTIAEYLDMAVSDKRIALGREKYAQHRAWLARAEAEFGVDRYVLMGVWGLETKYGTFMGDDYVIRSLATLAAAHDRGSYFRSELIRALVILQEGHVAPARMMGSWAGAMGQTQFMPSNFRPYAVDFDGDGRRDIWTSVADAIGSTANFLEKHGWTRGEPWGYEVRLPAGFDRASGAGRSASFATWAARGVERADAGALPRGGTATLLRPAGAAGPVFLVTPNFKVIRSYNNSLSYALGVALLGDRIAGREPLKARWPGATVAEER